jgi:NAD(P)-dependent dehydrogenase (short-subunit alcohol dehydrogenase family)
MTYLEQLFSLEGKIAVVTGASRGIGRGLAEALLKGGARVILVATNSERLDETTRAFKEQDLPAVAYRCDLEDPQQIDGLADYVKSEYGRIDVLVNAAGVTFGHDLDDYPDDLWEKTLKTNLEAPFRLCRSFAPLFKEQGSGSIVNITSISAELGAEGNPAYGAAKGGLKQLTKALAVDLGPYGIRVNNIGPGYFRTDMTLRSWNDPEMREKRTRRTVLNRWGTTEDLAGLIVLLASDASSYITGQDLYIDGGWLVNFM